MQHNLTKVKCYIVVIASLNIGAYTLSCSQKNICGEEHRGSAVYEKSHWITEINGVVVLIRNFIMNIP